ncbi:MAG: glycosyltransferase 87 family protein [Thermoanaerobaculia bacterium]
MRPVEGEQREHAVVESEGSDLAAAGRHQVRSSGHRFTLWLLVLAAEAVYLGFLWLPDARRRLPAYLLLAAAAGLLSLLAAAILSASRPGFLLLCAALFRATLLWRAPDLSDDIHRYLWDARVASSGISPWARAPEDPVLEGLDPALSARVAHREIRTVYPPVAEAAFRAGSLGGESLPALKALFVAADVAIVWLLARRGSGAAAALYAFHPLPVLEVAGQGHLDPLGVALLLASLAFLSARRPLSAGVSFALSVLTKYVSLAAVIPIARAGRWRLVLSGAAVAAAVWFLSARGGASPAGGLAEYAGRWEFNSALYPTAVRLVRSADLPARAKSAFLDGKERLGHPAWAQSVFPYFSDGFFARAALGTVLLLLLAAIGWRVRDPRTATFASLCALLLFSPTLHPWYLLWTLPFAAERREPAFLYLSFAVPLSYGLLHPTPGLSRPLIFGLQYLPFALLLAGTLLKARRRARAACPAGVAP